MLAIVIAGLGASSLPAVAAPGDGTLTVDLTQTTGTGPFDADNLRDMPVFATMVAGEWTYRA